MGEADKKYYFNSKENGEVVQIAVSLTCPKTPVTFNGKGGDLSFDDEGAPSAPGTPATTSSPVEMTDDEQATLERLMNELGL